MTSRCGLLIAVLVGLLGSGAAAAAEDARSPKPRPRAGRASAVPQPAPGTIPMDFSGMSRRVQDVSTPSNARANSGFPGPGGGALTPGIIPETTMKF